MRTFVLKTLCTALVACSLAACNEDNSNNAPQNKTDINVLLTKIKSGTPLLTGTDIKNFGTTVDGTNQPVTIYNSGYGSDGFVNPNDSTQFYALTDRGPNADVVNGDKNIEKGEGKAFPTPDFAPNIGLFQIKDDGSITLLKTITLKRSTGTNMTGLPNPVNGATKEVAYVKNDNDAAYNKLLLVDPSKPYDKTANPTKTDAYGIDSEGLAVMKDGTFWVSDEYGPHIVHFDASGKELERINAFTTGEGSSTFKVNGKAVYLPAEFANRRANRGMEGLTITPDQEYLVGIVQSALYNPNSSTKKSSLTRIVRISLKTGAVEQFVYQQTDGDSNCGIVAIDKDNFYVIERDGDLLVDNKDAVKKIFKINLSSATNLQTLAANSTLMQDPKLGVTIGGKTLEQVSLTPDGWTTLTNNKIIPVTKTLYLDAVKNFSYPHDKLEGILLFPNGTIGLMNDDDFGIIPQSLNGKDYVKQKYLGATSTTLDTNRLYLYPAPKNP